MSQTAIQPQIQFALCIRKSSDDDLELRKAYPVLPAAAIESGFVRVIDESGEDYLYPAENFVPLELPDSIKDALRAAGKKTSMNETTAASAEAIYSQMAGLDLPFADRLLRDIAHALAGGFEETSSPKRILGQVSGQDAYNCIPGNPTNQCHPELVVYCYDKDSLTDRMAKMVHHLTTDCPNTRLAVLVTSLWNPNIWRRSQNALRRSDAKIIVLLKTPIDVIRIV